MEFIKAYPGIAIAIAAALGWFLLSRKPETAAATGSRELPSIIPLPKSRAAVEVYEALGVVVAALRDNGTPESEVQSIVQTVAPKLYGKPSP